MIYQFEREKIEDCRDCPCFRTMFDSPYCSLSDVWTEIFQGIPDWCELKEVSDGD